MNIPHQVIGKCLACAQHGQPDKQHTDLEDGNNHANSWKTR